MPNHEPEHPGIDFFDVDHTIVDGATGLFSVFTGIQMGIFPLRIFLSIPAWYRLYYGGTKAARNAQQTLKEFKGIPKETIDRLGAFNHETKVRPKIFPEAENVIRQLSASGREVVFLSSSFLHLVRPLAADLAVEHVLVNELVYAEGKTTGDLKEPFVFGEEKRRLALLFMEHQGVLPVNCSFFTDSVFDLPFLEEVGRPVAVNPDRRLRRIARSRNWEIVTFTRG